MARHFGFLAIIGLLFGCSEQSPKHEAITTETPKTGRLITPPVVARKLQEDLYPPDYLAMKTAAVVTSVSYGNLQLDERSTDSVALYSSYSLFDCAETDDAEPNPKWRTDPLEELAKRVVGFASGLKTAGYSAQLYETSVAEYERRQLLIIAKGTMSVPEPELALSEWRPETRADRELQHLVESLERRRVQLEPEMPHIEGETGCGGGETPYRFRSIPAQASIWVASSFSFALCTARKVDPWDHDACDRWTEVGDGRARFLSGRFKYDARWPDGRIARGVRDLTDSDPGEMDDNYQPIPKAVIIRPTIK